MNLKYRINDKKDYKCKSNLSDQEIPRGLFYEALLQTHSQIDKFKDFDVDVFSLLGLRNLSAFVGELYGACFAKASSGLYRPNPHQDGYPDLILINAIGGRI